MVAALEWVAGGTLQPQSRVLPYSDADLLAFGRAIAERALAYKAIILGLDGAFLVLVFLWLFTIHSNHGYGVRGGMLSVSVIAVDFAENLMLLARLGLATKGNVEPGNLTAAVSPVYYVTLVKFALFAVAIGSVLHIVRRARA